MPRRPLREEEPFATIRAHPRRFGIGIPLVFAMSIGVALPLVGRSLSLAVAVQLALQTAGLLWLYLPPARRRWREARDAPPDDVEPPRGSGDAPRGAGAWLPFVLVGAVAACGDVEGGSVPDPVVTDSAGVTVVQFPEAAVEHPAPVRIADEPEVRLGVVDGAEAFSFSSIVGGFRTSEGHIVVVDSRGPPLRRFDADGGLLHTAGSRGEGPGELQAARAVLPTPDGGARIWDQRTRRFVRIGADGRALPDQPALPELPGAGLVGLSVPPTPVADTPSSVLAVYDRSTPPGIPESGVYGSDAVVVLRRVESDGSSLLDTVAVTPGGEAELQVTRSSGGMVSIAIAAPWFRRRAYSAAVSDGIWFTHGAAWEVRRYAAEGLRGVVRFDLEPSPFDATVRQAILDDLLERAHDPEQEARIRAAHEAREWPETFPPIRALFADAADRLWVGLAEGPARTLAGRSFTATVGYAVEHWIVLEPDGTRVVGRLRLPPRSAPLYADEVGVLLFVTDDLDVPFVEWRRFVAAGAESTDPA